MKRPRSRSRTSRSRTSGNGPGRLSVLSLATVLPLLAGCGILSPTTTSVDYDPANGVTAQVGEVVARDLLVVGDKGTAGLVSGALVNNGSADAAVTIQAEGQAQPVTVTVPPGQIVVLGSGSDQTSVVVTTVPTQAGALVPVTLSSPAGGTVKATVPVLPPRLDYATVTPTATPSATATGTATGTASAG